MFIIEIEITLNKYYKTLIMEFSQFNKNSRLINEINKLKTKNK